MSVDVRRSDNEGVLPVTEVFVPGEAQPVEVEAGKDGVNKLKDK